MKVHLRYFPSNIKSLANKLYFILVDLLSAVENKALVRKSKHLRNNKPSSLAGSGE